MYEIKIPFPDSDRVEYKNNPLIEVVCEIRFADLSASEELFVKFFKKLGGIFEKFEEDHTVELQVEILDSKIPNLKQSKTKFYRARDENNIWTLNLSETSMSLSCTSYKTWEDYKNKLRPCLMTLVEVFNVKVYSRCGLRYRNIIDKIELGFEKESWSELISEDVVDVMVSLGQPEDDLIEKTNIFTFRMSEDNDQVKINHGFVYNNSDKTRKAYLIDGDFSHQKETEVDCDSIITRLDLYRKGAGRMFRWAIREKLHKRLLD